MENAIFEIFKFNVFCSINLVELSIFQTMDLLAEFRLNIIISIDKPIKSLLKFNFDKFLGVCLKYLQLIIFKFDLHFLPCILSELQSTQIDKAKTRIFWFSKNSPWLRFFRSI